MANSGLSLNLAVIAGVRMGAVCFVPVVFLVSHFFLSTNVSSEEQVHCQHFKFVIGDDVIHDHILQDHVIKRLTVSSAIQCHLMCKDDCLCLSMNYFPFARESNCDLNDANKDIDPSSIKGKRGAQYYDLVRS